MNKRGLLVIAVIVVVLLWLMFSGGWFMHDDQSERQSDEILETAPFIELTVGTPTDGKAAILKRAEKFAAEHRMKVSLNATHFEPHEFSLALTRPDLNIVVANVSRGNRSYVTAYARPAPTSAHRGEVTAFQCEVMRNGCFR